MNKLTTSPYIDSLNEMLSILGHRASGTKQGIIWAWSPDFEYLTRRITPSWVLCRWRRPQMRPSAWAAAFPGIAYPADGYYAPWLETRLATGERPSVDLTQNYIFAIDRQMSTPVEQLERDAADQIKKNQLRDYSEWVEFVQDTAPAFNNFASGRSGSVSYGGI